MSTRTDTVIIGAGITGLTAAFYLKRAGRDVLILEEQDRAGGVIRTVREDGFLYETGPNTGVLGQPEAAELFEDLDGVVEAEIASPNVKRRYILKDGLWEPIPAGLVAAIRTPLFTFRDKFRILGEPFRPRGKDHDETLEQMVLRRMGRSYLDFAVDPFILGVYAGDPSALVPRYALPKLYRLEQEFGSFIGGAIRKKFRKKSDFEKKATREVFSVRGGLQVLTDALYRETGAERFLLGCKEIRTERNGDGFRISFTPGKKDLSGSPAVEPGGKQTIEANRVIITTGSHSLPDLLPGIGPAEMERLTNLRYARVIEVVLGFKRWKGMDPDGFGGLIPYREQRDLLGVLFPSAFLEGRAPGGGALFTLFIGGIRRPELFELADDEIRQIVSREFTDLMGIDRFSPDLFRIFRYRYAIPQYEINSGDRFRTVEKIENEYPGLYLRGNFQGGIGLADRIRQGRIAADEIIRSEGPDAAFVSS